MNRHSAVKMYPLTVILLAVAAKFVSCRPNGASTVSCATMRPDHINPLDYTHSKKQLVQSPYRLAATWDIPKKMVRVSVSGRRIQGFLIQGRNEINGPAIGSFVNITENPDATYQDCKLYVGVCELIVA